MSKGCVNLLSVSIVFCVVLSTVSRMAAQVTADRLVNALAEPGKMDPLPRGLQWPKTTVP